MQGRVFLAGAAVTVALAATPAAARESRSTRIVATGIATVRVHPKNRHSNSSIRDAVKAADKIALKRAFRDGHKLALRYAKAEGLKLGRLISVSDTQEPSGYGSGSEFGPNKYCGKVRVPVGKQVYGQKPTLKTVRRCFVPPYIVTGIQLTYSAN